jgi:hypothetical protein
MKKSPEENRPSCGPVYGTCERSRGRAANVPSLTAFKETTMFGFRTKPVDTVASSSRCLRSQAKLGLETLEARDIPSSFAASALPVSSVHHIAPQPMMAQVAEMSVETLHHYPPSPV